MQGSAVLFSEMVPHRDWEDEFNAWYDEEHIPDRMCLPGFVSVQRYRTQDGTYLVIYEIDGLKTLQTPGYHTVKTEPSERTSWMLGSVSGFTRNLGTVVAEQGRPEVAMGSAHDVAAVFLDLPPSEAQKFDEWLLEEPFQKLFAQGGYDAARVFALAVSEPDRFTRLVVLYRREYSGNLPPETLRDHLGGWLADGSFKIFKSWGDRVHGAAQGLG
jgi:hypothetical protein